MALARLSTPTTGWPVGTSYQLFISYEPKVRVSLMRTLKTGALEQPPSKRAARLEGKALPSRSPSIPASSQTDSCEALLLSVSELCHIRVPASPKCSNGSRLCYVHYGIPRTVTCPKPGPSKERQPMFFLIGCSRTDPTLESNPASQARLACSRDTVLYVLRIETRTQSIRP